MYITVNTMEMASRIIPAAEAKPKSNDLNPAL